MLHQQPFATYTSPEGHLSHPNTRLGSSSAPTTTWSSPGAPLKPKWPHGAAVIGPIFLPLWCDFILPKMKLNLAKGSTHTSTDQTQINFFSCWSFLFFHINTKAEWMRTGQQKKKKSPLFLASSINVRWLIGILSLPSVSSSLELLWKNRCPLSWMLSFVEFWAQTPKISLSLTLCNYTCKRKSKPSLPHSMQV